MIIFEGFQSKCHSPQFALQAHELYKARHGFTKSMQEIASIDSITEYINATSCVNFAKSCLGSQCSEARRINCGLLLGAIH